MRRECVPSGGAAAGGFGALDGDVLVDAGRVVVRQPVGHKEEIVRGGYSGASAQFARQLVC